MLNKGEHTTNADALDKLLKDSFLDLDLDDPKNDSMIDALSASVMTPTALQHTKAKRSFKGIIGKISLQSILLFCLLTFLVIGFVFFRTQSLQKKQQPVVLKENPQPTVKNDYSIYEKIAEAPSLTENSKTVKEKSDPVVQQSASSGNVEPTVVSEIPSETSGYTDVRDNDYPEYIEPLTATDPLPIVKEKDELPLGLPQFTSDDVKANYKQKKKMMDQLIKPVKPNYALIPSGKTEYKGVVKRTGDFYMACHEVTNQEYRAFLFDLIYQKRKEEYLKAKPNNALWVNCTGTGKFNSLKTDYFSNKGYDNFPVVNITAEAAKMYCIWLDTLLKSREDENVKFYIDLPKESEWIYAAKGGSTSGVYAWGTDQVQNDKNIFLANFSLQRSKDQLQQPYSYTAKANPSFYSSAGLATNTDTLATTSVFEYNPNSYGLFCMSGNAAEWVLSEDGQNTKAIGGSWGSDLEHLKISSEEEFKGVTCSPFIGFRILVSVIQLK